MTVASPPSQTLDRAKGTLFGLALGDALGMPSQTLTRDEIRSHYGIIDDFTAPYPDHPVSHGLRAAQVTDDTEQAILLARRLISAPGAFDQAGWARDLLDWEADVRRRGLRDLLGPSTKAALAAIEQGVEPAEAAGQGTTNGAAMRIAPVGIALPCDDLSVLVDAVAKTCSVTHNTGEAIAASAAVAAAISARIGGADDKASLALALRAAELGQQRGTAFGVRDMPARISRAANLGQSGITPDDFAREIGTSVASRESVPAAFGLVHMAQGDVWRTALLAANIGDDTDTIGAIAGAICGAGSGMAGFPPAKLATLTGVNTLDIDGIAKKLVTLRHSGADFPHEVAR